MDHFRQCNGVRFGSEGPYVGESDSAKAVSALRVEGEAEKTDTTL
jgi:hypothetical protein